MELYDLKDDPLEQRDVAEEFADVAKDLEERRLVWEKRLREASGQQREVVLSDEQTEKLRSLGYLGGSESTARIEYSLVKRGGRVDHIAGRWWRNGRGRPWSHGRHCGQGGTTGREDFY